MTPYLRFLVLVLAFVGLSQAANWCGTSWSNASKCCRQCPRGVDSECPGRERCFASVSCSPSNPCPPTTRPPPSGNPRTAINKSQFNNMFPSRIRFYDYDSFISAVAKFPGFLTTGTVDVQRREAAAFLANIAHESCNLRCTVELNKANYNSYCNETTATQNGFSPECDKNGRRYQYYGRGPIKLSWNYNYKEAGDALGLDLLHSPELVSTNSTTAWRTAIWFWMTSEGADRYTPHYAITSGPGFGETIRSINGALECNGKQPNKVQARVTNYHKFVRILGTTVGPGNLCC